MKCLSDFVFKLELMRNSVDLATEVVLEKNAQDMLLILTDKAASRCSAFVIALQAESCSEEMAEGGCKVLEEVLLEVLSVVQVLVRDKKGQALVLKKLKSHAVNVFDSVIQLVELLRGSDHKLVSPGTGVVWSQLALLGKLGVSSRVQVKALLESAEANVIDTIDEMQELPTIEEDEDEGLTAAELGRAAKALIAVKAARGVLKFGANSVSESDESKAVEVDVLSVLADSISRCVENLGCCLYAPQDADELKVALVDLIEAVDVFCEALLNVDSSEGCRKVKSVSQTLCKDALTKIEDAIARDKSKKK